jgi:hypothetical protein
MRPDVLERATSPVLDLETRHLRGIYAARDGDPAEQSGGGAGHTSKMHAQTQQAPRKIG